MLKSTVFLLTLVTVFAQDPTISPQLLDAVFGTGSNDMRNHTTDNAAVGDEGLDTGAIDNTGIDNAAGIDIRQRRDTVSSNQKCEVQGRIGKCVPYYECERSHATHTTKKPGSDSSEIICPNSIEVCCVSDDTQ